MPFFKPEQPFYTYSINIETLWGGLWYLFEIHHDEHGKMCILGHLYGNGCAPGPSSCKWHAAATSADTKQTDAEILATLCEPADGPDPMQRLDHAHRVAR